MAEIDTSDPYAYLEKTDFTSELFKIEIKNLHRHVGFGQIKKKLQTLGVKPHKVKIIGSITFVTFKTAVDRDDAITKLNGYVWKGNELIVKPHTYLLLSSICQRQHEQIAKGRADPCVQKRQAALESLESTDEKKAKLAPEIDPEERLRDVVTKLWRKPYIHQVEEKHKTTKNLLCQLFHKLVRENPLLHKHLQPVSCDSGQLACKLLDIVPSPIETCYRNKCEFTVGLDLEGKGPIVGFRYGKYRGGLNAVGPPHGLNLMPASMGTAVRRVQIFLSRMAEDGSGLPVLTAFDVETGVGHWRTVTVRVNRTGQVMLVLDLHPQDLTLDQMTKLEEEMVMFFTTEEGNDVNICSLFLSKRLKSAEPMDSSTTKHLYGDQYIYETVNGIKFQISYNSFFQINTDAAEILYREIGKLCDLSKNTILLDICSGTGTIGLALAKYVEKVIGVEICEEAVQDARKNAEANGIENAEFLVGRAQDVIPSVLMDIPQDRDVVAIVDPPRAGLHSNVIVGLRRCPQLKTIVYVSCNPAAAFANFVEFGRLESNRLRGDPIIPVRAIDFDLFPQTNHVELVMLMKRIEKSAPPLLPESPKDLPATAVTAVAETALSISDVLVKPSADTSVVTASAESSLEVGAHSSLDTVVTMAAVEPLPQ